MLLNKFIIQRKYEVGQPGQAGIVFFDKGFYSDNWRYIECASSNQLSSKWGGHDILISVPSFSVGSGFNNTAFIMNFWSSWRSSRILISNGGTWDGNTIDSVDYTGVQTQLMDGKIPYYYKWDGSTANNDPTTWTWISTWAAKVCSELTLNNKSDWALPSKDELNLMYTALKMNNIGDFDSSYYLSSSENISTKVWIYSFSNSIQFATNKYYNIPIRAIRVF